jgi:hypothetical protein
VSKIIKEWDLLDHAAKDNLQKLYQEKKFLTQDDISSSEALMRAEQKRRDDLLAARKAALHHAALAVPAQPTTTLFTPSKPRSDSDYNRAGSEQVADSKVDSSSPYAQVQAQKTKPIAKKPQVQYIQFYKRTYARLKAQHPRWHSAQITTLIKLEWKKQKKETSKRKSLVVSRQLKGLRKAISGRVFFRRSRGLNGEEAKRFWRRFPFETRKLWDNLSHSLDQKLKANFHSTRKYKPASGQENSSSLSYLRKLIR